MMSSWNKLCGHLRSSYRSALAENRERAMDTMLGTMIGVLFLSLLTTSFVGVFISYNLVNGKAKQNSQRFSFIESQSTNTLNQHVIDGQSFGYAEAVDAANGWTVLAHPAAADPAARQTLGAIYGVDGVNASYVNYTFAAEKEVSGERVAQWGELSSSGISNGLLSLYTAVPKSGRDSDTVCDWTVLDNVEFQNNCLVSYQSIPSVLSPPTAYTVETGVKWLEMTRQARWVSPVDYAQPTPQSVSTDVLAPAGTVSLLESSNGVVPEVVNGQRFVQVTVQLSGLESGKEVALDVKDSATGDLITTRVLPVAAVPGEGQTGLTRNLHFSLALPETVTALDMFFDTDRLNADDATDAPIDVSRFLVYQTVPTS